MTRVELFLLVLVFGCAVPALGANIVYYSSHSIPPRFLSFLYGRGHSVTTYSYISLQSGGISSSYDIAILQCENLSCNWDFYMQSYIESYMSSGGVFLYFGRDSFREGYSNSFGALGVLGAIEVGSGSSSFGLPISSAPQCYPLTNGYLQDLRNVIPQVSFPTWVANHFHDIEAVITDGVNSFNCLPNSVNMDPYASWSVRPFGAGIGVWMTVSTYQLDEFYIRGFYQVALLNLLGYATTGIVYGDPHVVTLARDKFELPSATANNYFNFFSSIHLNVRAYLHTRPEWEGLWVTEIGVRFLDRDQLHHLHCYISDELEFKFVLDGQELESEYHSGTWEYVLNNEAMIGAWHNMKDFSSPGMFRLETEDGSKLVIQAVSWKDAPSFSFEVHEGVTPHILLQTRTLETNIGMLQHPKLSLERNVLPDVLSYKTDGLFPQ